MNDGADVLMQNTDSSAVLQAAEKAGKFALRLGLGHERSTARRRTSASAVINWAPYYKKAVKDALDGTWKTGQTWWGVKEGAIDLVSLSDKVPADAEEEGRDGEGGPQGRHVRDLEGADRRSGRQGRC